MTYRAIAASETDVESPTNVDLVTALAENPPAIAACDTDAPYVQSAWHPYNGAEWGDGQTGLFYNHAVDGTVSTLETPHFVDGYEYRVIFNGLSPSLISALFVKLYQVTTDAFTIARAITGPVALATDSLSGHVTFFRPRWSVSHHIFSAVWDPSGDYSAGTPRQGITVSPAQKIRSAEFSFGGGATIDAGQMYLLRRRAFAP